MDEFRSLIEELVKTIKEIRHTPTAAIAEQKRKYNLQGIILQSYDENNESFDCYISRLQNYIDLKGWTNDKSTENEIRCSQIFLNCIGPKY